jgi:hypothetical protein
MTFSRWYPLGYLLLAVVLSTLLTSLVQSSVNLSAIAALTGTLALADILFTLGFDLRHFSITYAPIALLNLLSVALLVKLLPALARLWLASLIAAVVLYLMLHLINSLAPMPTLIAANRSEFGTLGMMLCSAAGMACYLRLIKRRQVYAQI